MTQTSPARKAVRALVVNGRDELLLIHWEDPLDGHEILEPPGGAVEPDESLEAAILRETAEETGWDIQLCGAPRPHFRKTTWAGQTYEGTEWFCLARPLTAGQQALETYERPWFRGVKWVPIDRLHVSQIPLEPPHLVSVLKDVMGQSPDSTGGSLS